MGRGHMSWRIEIFFSNWILGVGGRGAYEFRLAHEMHPTPHLVITDLSLT